MKPGVLDSAQPGEARPSAPGCRRRELLLAGLAAPVALPVLAETGSLEVIYPRLLERPAEAYGYQALALALQRAGVRHVLKLTEAPISAAQTLALLERGEVSVLDNAGTDKLSSRFDVVPVPLDLGLSGCRLLLGRRETLARLDGVRSLAELQAFSFGQGLRWVDTRILRAAGLSVEEGSFANLLRMLQAGRFDLVALGAEEAHELLERQQAEAPDVRVHEGVALVYPQVRLFYVTKGNVGLRTAIIAGLEAASADGSLQALLKHSPGLGPLLSGERVLPPTLIGIRNPWWPEELRSLPLARFHPALRKVLRGMQIGCGEA